MGVKGLQSAENTLRVLEAISEHQPVGVSELGRRAGLDKNAVQRILVTLEQAGWARRAALPPVRWELTSKAFVVGRRFGSDLRDRARPLLEELQSTTGETALLWSVSGDQVAVIDAVESHDPLRATVPVGFETSLTVAPEFLAYFSPAFRSRVEGAPPPGPDSTAGRGAGPPRSGGGGVGAPPGPDSTAGRGAGPPRSGGGGVGAPPGPDSTTRPWYVIDTGFTNVRSVGSPVYGVDGEVTGAVMVLGPVSRLEGSAPEDIGPLVTRAATILSDWPGDGHRRALRP